jgi:hypothetical protein
VFGSLVVYSREGRGYLIWFAAMMANGAATFLPAICWIIEGLEEATVDIQWLAYSYFP